METFVITIAVFFILALFLSLLPKVFEIKGSKITIVADRTANLLISSQGVPANWHTNNASSLGLVIRRNVIDWGKTQAIGNTDYLTLLSIYPYKLRLFLITNQTIWQTGSINESGDVAIFDRLCLINGTLCKLRIEVST